MAEGFTVTPKAEKVLREIVAEHQRRLPASDRRTRRVYPQGGSKSAMFIIDINMTTFIGARDSGGVTYEGDAFRVISANDDFEFTLDATEVTINAKHFDGLLIPGRYYVCEQKFGKWIPTDHGQSQFSKCVASGAGIEEESGEAVIYLRDAGAVESIGVECIVPEGAEPIPAGTSCTCFWDAERQVMWAVPHGCPPTSE